MVTIHNDFNFVLHTYTCSLHSEKFGSATNKSLFKNFVTKLANVTFENIDELPMNNTFGIASHQYMDLLWNLSWIFHPEVSSGTGNKLHLQDTITELGICYSVNSRVAIYNSYE